MRTFLEIDESLLRGATIILDVDGTISHDGGSSVEPDVREKIRRISAHSRIFLSSNGNLDRTKRLASEVGVECIDTSYKKPSRRIIESLPEDSARYVVIGDKMLTDGLLAVNMGAEYIPVSHIRAQEDSIMTRFIYGIDDAAAMAAKVAYPAFKYLALMRPSQWLKNVLVFAPLFFAGSVFVGPKFLETSLAFLVFCLVSSAMYVLNDVHDREQDRMHPVKRGRPIASGAISVRAAYGFLAALLVLSGIVAAMIPAAVPVLIVYIMLNAAYSRYLKHIAILDIVLVAAFYVLRIAAGGAAAAVAVSPWIVLVVFFGALFLAVGKRRAEQARSSRRKVLESYGSGTLDFLLACAATLAVISYGIYTILGGHSQYAVYSTVFVCAAIFILLNRMYRSDAEAEYPESLVFKDRSVLMLTCAWAVFMFILLYV